MDTENEKINAIFSFHMSTPITETVICKASANSIWKALTDPAQMKVWYFSMIDFEPIVGNRFYFYEPGENKKFKHECEILEIIPNAKLSHTWTYPELTKGSSVVIWNLQEENGLTTVTLTHEGLESFADGGPDFVRTNFEAGWHEILGKSLKEYIEK